MDGPQVQLVPKRHVETDPDVLVAKLGGAIAALFYFIIFSVVPSSKNSSGLEESYYMNGRGALARPSGR
jgi:hypothetical protein